MSSANSPCRGPWLAPLEFTFLGSVILVWSLLVIVLGKDTSWDFRNYHWYIPYAFLNGRLGFDVAVAHQATYYNPFLDIPFYLLASHTPSWVAIGVMGAAQGANIVPLYLMARSVLDVPHKKLASSILSLFCVCGGLNVGLVGATYYDNVMSVFVLTGLAAIVLNRERLRDGPFWQVALICGIAGFIIGSAVGLKLPEAPFALGFAGMLLAMPGGARCAGARLLGGAIGGVFGVAAFAGFWMLTMYHETGNPLFPYFNQYFQSPLALHASYRDTRFIPRSLSKRLLFPILFSLDWRVADDLPFQDSRVGLAYLVGLITVPISLFGRARDPIIKHSGAVPLFVFAGVSYLTWLLMFGIYRYIIVLEMLAPILVVSAIGLWPLGQRTRYAILVIAGVLLLATTRYDFLEHAPLDDPYVRADPLPFRDPDRSMILMTGDSPMGFIAPTLPHQIPILRIDGWMIQPKDGSLLTKRTRRRVKSFHGDLYAIADDYEVGRAGAALADYGLGMRWPECQIFTTNLGGRYRFCPLKHLASPNP